MVKADETNVFNEVGEDLDRSGSGSTYCSRMEYGKVKCLNETLITARYTDTIDDFGTILVVTETVKKSSNPFTMEPGSINASITAMSCSAIGAGVLTLPYAFAMNGWLVGCFFNLIGAIAALWSGKLLAQRAQEH